MDEDKKKLEVVSGDGKNLDISPVYGHLNTVKPKCDNKPKNIVIPKTKDKKNKDNEDEKNEEKGGNA